MEDCADEYFTSPTELTDDRKDGVRDRAQLTSQCNDGQKLFLAFQ